MLKATVDIVKVFLYSLTSSADGCKKAIRLIPIANTIPCEEENKHKNVPKGGFLEILRQVFTTVEGGPCQYGICVDIDAVATALPCTPVELRKCEPIEAFDITDGKTKIETTVPYADYTEGDGKFWFSLNGKEINESSSPTTVSVVDNEGMVCFELSAPVGEPGAPCDVKAELKFNCTLMVVTCPN